jgi:hypothetical protein
MDGQVFIGAIMMNDFSKTNAMDVGRRKENKRNRMGKSSVAAGIMDGSGNMGWEGKNHVHIPLFPDFTYRYVR